MSQLPSSVLRKPYRDGRVLETYVSEAREVEAERERMKALFDEMVSSGRWGRTPLVTGVTAWRAAIERKGWSMSP